MVGSWGFGGGVRGDFGGDINYDQGPVYGDDQGGSKWGAVVMVYGMEPDKFNCARLFNLFCQYGNINRIMFLKNKEGTAMVEMDCGDSVNKSIQNLNHTAIFGLKLRLDWSKKDFIDEVRNPHELADGSLNYCDFSRDSNNRFNTADRAAKNRIIAPTRILHFYNVPKMENTEMEDIYSRLGAPLPAKIKWFPAKSDKSVSGLCEFDSVQESCEAIVLVNHTEIQVTNKGYPYCMKLCFSPATH